MIKKYIICLMLSFVFIMGSTGCLSNGVLQESKKKIALKKAISSDNQPAIRAIKLGDDGIGLGIDVGNLEALKEQLFKQIGAAIGDALIVWAGYEAANQIKGLNDNNSSGISITINGDGNQIDLGNLRPSEN